MQDDGVREVHGVAKNDGDILVTVREQGSVIRIEMGHMWATMNPKRAHYFARQLNRLARRIENREPPSA